MPGWLPSGAAWGPGLVVAGACAVLGLLMQRVVRPSDHFLGPRAAIAGSVWHAGMLAIVVAALALDDVPIGTFLRESWIGADQASIPAAVAIPVLVLCGVVALMWSRIPVLKRFAAAADPTAYAAGGRLGAGGLALQILVRYPLTIVSEETVFRGYLQMHLHWGVVAASVAFAAYHVTQWRTIPSLLPYAFALGVLAAWTGSLITGGILHYVMDAGFALVIVLPQQRRRERATSK